MLVRRVYVYHCSMRLKANAHDDPAYTDMVVESPHWLNSVERVDQIRDILKNTLVTKHPVVRHWLSGVGSCTIASLSYLGSRLKWFWEK